MLSLALSPPAARSRGGRLRQAMTLIAASSSLRIRGFRPGEIVRCGKCSLSVELALDSADPDFAREVAMWRLDTPDLKPADHRAAMDALRLIDPNADFALESGGTAYTWRPA